MINVIVDSRVRVPIEGLPDDVAKALRAAFIHQNIKRLVMEKAKIGGFWNEPRLIPTWGESRGCFTFPRGGVGRVREVLKKADLKFRLVDHRLKYEPKDSVPDTQVSVWPHQERIIQACVARENCLIKSGTGSGKTTALLALYSRIKVPTLVVVHSAALMKQWVERAQAELGLHARDVGIVGSGKARVRDLTIGIQKSVAIQAENDPDFRLQFGAVFADEVHKFAARTFFGCIDPFPARYRIGASDDAKRKDKKEFLIYDLFGDVAESVSDRELVEGGHVMDVEILVVPTEFRADWYGLPSEEDDSKRPEFGRLLEEMAADSGRQEVLERVIEAELAQDRQVLAMAHRREHCLAIGAFAARRATSGYLIGGMDYADEFERTVRGMKAGKIRCGVGTYQATGTGIDIPGVEVVVACTPILSNKSTFRQARGRGCRAKRGKTTARMYVLWDQHVFGLRHLANASSWGGSTFVWDGGAWVPAKQYLKAARVTRAKEEQDGEA